MAVQKCKFAAYRYSFVGLEREAADDNLLQIIKVYRQLDSNRGMWRIGNLHETTIGGVQVITGILGLQQSQSGFTYDEETHDYILAEQSNRVEDLSRFLIQPRYHLIAVEHRGTIKPETFITQFKKIVMSEESLMLQIVIEPVLEEYEFLKAVKELQRIEIAKLVLHPSNPNNRDLWKRQDEDMRKMKAIEVRQTIKARPNTGLVVAGTSLEESIAQIEDGYGSGTVTGKTAKGESVVVNSVKKQTKFEIEQTNDEDVNAQVVIALNRLQERIGD